MKALVHERRTIDQKDKERLKNASQKIKQCIRDKKRSKRQEKMQQIMHNL